MRILFLTALATMLWAGAVRAQDDFFDEEDAPYVVDVFYPKLFYTSKEGLSGGVYYAIIRDFSFSDFDSGLSPASYRASLAFNGLVTTEGSRSASLVFSAPALAAGWRFFASIGGRRDNRDGYYGIGNASTFDASLVTDAQPRFYQAQRDRFRFRAEAQRQVVNHIRVLAGFNVDRTRLSSLNGASVLENDIGAGTVAGGRFGTEVVARVGLVVDTRNNEVAPTSGVFVEGILGVSDEGIGSDASYTRTTLSARGYLPAGDLLSFAGRFLVQSMSGSPSIPAYYLIEESDRVFDGLGGRRSHRAIRENRLLGRNKLLLNGEARYVLYGIPTLYTLSLVGFIDAGRVFEPDPLRLTFSDMLVGGGGGLFFQLGPRLVMGGTLGVGPDGLVGNFHTQWPF